MITKRSFFPSIKLLLLLLLLLLFCVKLYSLTAFTATKEIRTSRSKSILLPDDKSGKNVKGVKEPETPEVIYAAFFVKPEISRTHLLIPCIRTIKSILLAEDSSVLVYTFPDDIVEYMHQHQKIATKILSETDYGRIYHERGLKFDAAKLKTEMMLIRIDMYLQFLKKHCCSAHIIFTDLDQLFFSSIAKFMNDYSTRSWDMAHVHKSHGNNAGLFLFRNSGNKYGQRFMKKALTIFNSTKIRNKICKHNVPCLKLGGEQEAVDMLLSKNDVNYGVNLRNWYSSFLGGVVLNLDARIFNAVPGRFEVIPNTKIMHFMGGS